MLSIHFSCSKARRRVLGYLRLSRPFPMTFPITILSFWAGVGSRRSVGWELGVQNSDPGHTHRRFYRLNTSTAPVKTLLSSCRNWVVPVVGLPGTPTLGGLVNLASDLFDGSLGVGGPGNTFGRTRDGLCVWDGRSREERGPVPTVE